jgi:small subunit ribosomal protein S1
MSTTINFATPTDEFDWDGTDSKGFGAGYSDAQIAETLELIDDTVSTIAEKELITATVVGLSHKDLF